MVHCCSVRSRRPSVPLVFTLISTLAACSDSTAPESHREFEPAASVRWNGIARDLVIKYRTDPPLASRTYALLSVAQDRAVRAVAGASGTPKPLDHAAVVGASVAILTAAYPAEVAVLDSTARGDLADPVWSANASVSVPQGESIGRSAAQTLMNERVSDGAQASWSGSVPPSAPFLGRASPTGSSNRSGSFS